MAVKPVAKTKPSKSKEKRGRGRPTKFGKKVTDEILNRMANGETLSNVCKSDTMPDRTTVRRWLERDAKFSAAYTRARELLADALADEAIRIADDATGDITKDAKGKDQVNWEAVQRARLRVDTRKWMAAKLFPKRYNDRITQELVGNPEAPLEIAPSKLTQREIIAEVARLFGEAEKEAGLPSGHGKSNEERLEAIRAAQVPLPPTLYDLLHTISRGPNDAVH
jgi:hypothetical protein